MLVNHDELHGRVGTCYQYSPAGKFLVQDLFLYLGRKDFQFIFLSSSGNFVYFGYFPFRKNERIDCVWF